MKKGFIMSGKIGVLPQTRTLGAIPIPISTVRAYDSCPAPYTRNAFGVCVLGPDLVAGSGTIYTGPVIMAGRR